MKEMNLSIKVGSNKEYNLGVAVLEYQNHKKTLREDFSLWEGFDVGRKYGKLYMLKCSLDSIKPHTIINVYTSEYNNLFKNKKDCNELIEEIKGIIIEKNLTLKDCSSDRGNRYFSMGDDALRRYRERLGHAKVRIYLDVPYSDKEEAKKKGAKWDSYNRKWYCNEYDVKKFSKWSV